MAAAASTALLRSVATKMARRPGPGPASSSSRRFSSSPTGASTPPNKNKDAPHNKIDLRELELAKTTLIKVTTGVVKCLAFGSVIYMFVMVKPAVEELRETFDAIDRKISNRENFKEIQIGSRDLVPEFSASQSTQSSASSSK